MVRNVLFAAIGVMICGSMLWGSPSTGGFGRESESRRLYAEIREAQSGVTRAFVQIRREMLESAEYQNALFELRRAAAELRAARDAALAPLRHSNGFTSIRIEIEAMERELDELRADSSTNRGRIAQQAEQLLHRRGKLSALESDVLVSDESYQDARYALIDANIALASVRADFEQAIRTDPRIVAARERLAQARQRLRDYSRR